ncbi:MAG: ribosome small subunit-dependent GTPase A [Myxococcota bacterium]
MESWGWDEDWNATYRGQVNEGLRPARVTVGYRRLYDLATAEGIVTAARLAGKYKHEHEAEGPAAFPAVGDWVAVDLSNRGTPMIRDLLPRRTAFYRKAAGRADDAQVVAANVDTVLLVSALDVDFNPRRIERYLAMAHESGARPVIVLNKTDVCDDVPAAVATLDLIRGDAPVHAISAKADVEGLRGYFSGNETVALLGSSGVGKSTITNRFLGDEVQKTRTLGVDGKGRHTTTNRYLFQVPGGGLILDTPGMRALHVWEGHRGLEEAFADIFELAHQCKFRDCTHRTEPGCAVRGAVSAERLAAYHTLRAEMESLEDESRQRRYR